MLSNYEVMAINQIIPNADFEIINGTDIVWNDDRLKPTQEEIRKIAKEIENNIKKDILIHKLEELINKKTREVKKTINDSQDISIEKIERYVSKYNDAKDYIEGKKTSSFLEIEASLLGITIDSLSSKIYTIGRRYKVASNEQNILIDACRVYIKDKINKYQFELAGMLIYEVNKIDFFTKDKVLDLKKIR